jgi:hypothetical protein
LAYSDICAQDAAERKRQEAEVALKVEEDAEVFLAYVLSLDAASDNGLGNGRF